MNRKQKIKITISCVVTLGLTVALLKYSTDLMERKASDFKYEPFFEQEENFDVLFMGTSHVINGVFPMELWNDYGIVSYNFGGHSNALATTYWVMENALDYTTPKLMVIDCYLLSGMDKTSSNFSFVHLSFDAFPFSRTKVNAVLDLFDDENIEEERDPMDLLWNYSTYHARWSKLTENDFEQGATKEKGAESRIRIEVPDEVTKIPAESKLEEDTVAIEYLERMIEDCQARGIDVLLTYIPFPSDARRQKEANRVYDIAKKYGVNYINFLDMDIVDYETDNYGSSHLNPSGARKVTDYIGQYIMEYYDISDQRENEVYSSWYVDYEDYKAYKVSKLQDIESLDLYLMLLADKNYSTVVEIYNPEIWKNDYYVKLFENLGVERSAITDDTDFLVIQEAGKQVNYLQGFHTSGYIAETALGDFSLFMAESASDEETGTYGVYLDDEEFYIITPEQNKESDIRIVVIDKDTMEIVDNVSFFCVDKVFQKNP